MSGFGYNVLGFGANASSAAAGGASDDQFNRTSFLSHFEGSNNGVNNQFTDASTSNHTVTAAGNVTQGSFGPFARPDGEWAVDFEDGDSLAVASSSDFNFGTSNFTWECFVFQKSRSAFQLIMTQDDYSSGNSISCWLTDTGQASIYYEGGGTHFTTTATVPLNTWTHLAWVRKGTGTNEFSIYIDGTAEVSGTMTTSFDQDGIIIGQQANGNYDFIGNISNIRIVNGSAVYTGNFTTPTSALTAVTNTKLLTCQSNRFVDNSASAHTITPAGSPAVTSFGPLLTSAVYDAAVNGASAYFDGTADALSIAASPISASGNFTLEGWVYSNSASEQAIVGQYQGRSTGRMIITTGSGLLIFFQNGVTGGNNGSSVALGQWAHFVLQRTGSNIAFYVNGARVLNNSAGNIAQDYLVIGTEDVNSGNYPNTMDGYISNIRVTSSAVYSEGTTITVPTAPYSTVTNTNFLLNMADGQAIDSAAQNNLTLYGTAKTSTAQYKFGTASLLLDGNSDYAKTSGYVGSITDGKTIECWVYAASISSKMCIWEWYEDDNNLLRLFFEGGNGNVLRLDQRNGGSTIVGTTGATTLSATTWYHLAATRTASGAWKVYINGTADTDLSGSESGTTLDITDIPLYLGVDFWGTDRYWDGYIDDFRVSELDRYASGNFTAPTKAFADKGQ